MSTWLTEAAADRLRNQLIGAALDAWEEEDRPLTDDEISDAAALLGRPPVAV